MVRVLIAVSGAEDPAWFGRVAEVAVLRHAEYILLAHVVDTGPRDDMMPGPGRYPGRRRADPDRAAAINAAEQEGSDRILRHAVEALHAAGAAEPALRTATLRGRPNEALRDLANAELIDLIVVAGRPGKPGPHSLGKTARFLVDHTPTAALLVR